MGARSRKMSKREIESIDSIMPFSSESMTKDAQKMRKDLGPRPYGAPPRFAGDDPWLSPERENPGKFSQIGTDNGI